MKESQLKDVERLIASHKESLRRLEASKPRSQDVETQIESHSRSLQILEAKQAIEGVYESLEAVQRGEQGVPLKELKRKSKSA
jgi:hypothetical protein